mmetsp:Transcript_6740/g.11838  ORF Transcript_6740/g.11838 Transcript_6740/m.11838 type:complete len:903 (-) Transcript_6740:77-2785(-)
MMIQGLAVLVFVTQAAYAIGCEGEFSECAATGECTLGPCPGTCGRGQYQCPDLKTCVDSVADCGHLVLLPVANASNTWMMPHEGGILMVTRSASLDETLTITRIDSTADTTATIPNFYNGLYGVQLGSEPLVATPAMEASGFSLGGYIHGRVAAIDSDRAFVVWVTRKSEESCDESLGCLPEVWGQVVHRVHGIAGDPSRISTTTNECDDSDQWHVGITKLAVAKLTSGSFVVVWTFRSRCFSHGGWPSNRAQLVSIAGSTGTLLGTEFVVGTVDSGIHPLDDIEVEALPGDRFVTAYGSGYSSQLVIKVFQVSGSSTLVVKEIRRSSPKLLSWALAALSSGGFVFIETQDPYGPTSPLQMDIYDNSGNLAVPLQTVFNKQTFWGARVAPHQAGFTIVAQVYDADLPNAGLRAKTFNHAGELLHDEFVLNYPSVGFYSNIDVASFEGDKLLVAWQNQNAKTAVWGQVVDYSGRNYSLPFVIAHVPYQNRAWPSIAVLSADHAMVAWATPIIGEHMEAKVLNVGNLIDPLQSSTCNVAGTEHDDVSHLPSTCTGRTCVAGFAGDDILSTPSCSSGMLMGGRGRDSFIIHSDSNVTILDFNISEDMLDLSAVMTQEMLLWQRGDDAVISLAGHEVVLVGVKSDDWRLSDGMLKTSTSITTSSRESTSSSSTSSLRSTTTSATTSLTTASSTHSTPTVSSVSSSVSTSTATTATTSSRKSSTSASTKTAFSSSSSSSASSTSTSASTRTTFSSSSSHESAASDASTSSSSTTASMPSTTRANTSSSSSSTSAELADDDCDSFLPCEDYMFVSLVAIVGVNVGCCAGLFIASALRLPRWQKSSSLPGQVPGSVEGAHLVIVGKPHDAWKAKQEHGAAPIPTLRLMAAEEGVPVLDGQLVNTVPEAT